MATYFPCLRIQRFVAARVFWRLFKWLAIAACLIGWLVIAAFRSIIVAPLLRARLLGQYMKIGEQAYRNKIDIEKGATIRDQIIAVDHEAEVAGSLPIGEQKLITRLGLIMALVMGRIKKRRLLAMLGKVFTGGGTVDDVLSRHIRRAVRTAEFIKHIRSTRPNVAAAKNFVLGIAMVGAVVIAHHIRCDKAELIVKSCTHIVDNGINHLFGNSIDLFEELSQRGAKNVTVDAGYRSILHYTMVNAAATSKLEHHNGDQYFLKELMRECRDYHSSIKTNLYCYDLGKFSNNVYVKNHDNGMAILSIVVPFQLHGEEDLLFFRTYQTAGGLAAYINEIGKLTLVPEQHVEQLLSQGVNVYRKKSSLCELVLLRVNISALDADKYTKQGKAELRIKLYLNNLQYAGPLEKNFFGENIRWYSIAKDRYILQAINPLTTTMLDRFFNVGLYDRKQIFRTTEIDYQGYISASLVGYEIFDESGKQILEYLQSRDNP